MTFRRWGANLLLLGLSCAGACMFDSSPIGSPLRPVEAESPTQPPVAGTGEANAAGTHSMTITAEAGTSAAGMSGREPIAGSGGSSSPGSTAPAGTDPPTTTGASGGSAAGSGGSAAASGAGAAGSGGSSGPAMTTTGTLPAIADPAMPGAFTVKRTNNVGPLNSYTTFEPVELGKDGIKHPIFVWGPSAGANPDIYLQLLNHIASHGFVVVAYNTAAQGPELTRGIDWILSEGQNVNSVYFEKLDTAKIAMGGQSAGSLATFTAGKEERRITTTVHLNGGTFNYADPTNLIKPALIVCGDDPAKTGGDGTWRSDLARPNCDADFMNATVPVWYGVVIGSSHTTVIDNPLDMTVNPLKVHYLASTVAWLRWQLGGDLTMKALFVGPDCGYCKQAAVWEVKQKDLM